MGFEKIAVEAINENFIKNIGSEWMLITAGNSESFNTMTASWGFAGVMWGKPCAVAAIRPQRYTYEFTEREKYYTLSFYGDDKSVHAVCGSKSGRNVDKISLTGLKPVFDPDTGAPYFEQARLVLICKKLYSQDLEENCFYDKSLVDKNYPAKDFHRMYYGEIVSALIKI